MNHSIPFARPDISELEVEAVVRTLKSGILTNGSQIARFESFVALALGGKVQVIATNSGTAALHMALLAAGVREGDEVILPTLAFAATIEAVVMARARPILVDCDLTRNINTEMVAQKISSNTQAILPVHIGGFPCNLKRLKEIADANNTLIVEDAAHAFGSTYDGKPIGSLEFSQLAAFSFYATKPITTGEGGCVVTSNSKIADYCRRIRLHGIRLMLDEPGWNYDVAEMGYKYNMNEIQAAIGIAQLSRTEAMRQRREKIAKLYEKEFANLPLSRPPVNGKECKNEKLSWHLYSIELPDGVDRDKFIAKMQERGVGCSVHYKPIHLHSYWARFGGWSASDFPIALRYWQRCVSLPIYSSMSESDAEKVVDTVKICLDSQS